MVGCYHWQLSRLIFLGVRQAVPAPLGAFFPTIPDEHSAVHCLSIAAEAAWRLDGDQVVEIEIDDGLQGCRGGGVAETVRRGVVPGDLFGSQGDQPSDSVVPALCECAPVGWPPIADDRRCLLGLAVRAIASLAF